MLADPLKKLLITSKFGIRKHPITGEEKMHYGIDLAADINTPVFAIADGIIDFIGMNGDFGKYILLSHTNTVQSAYAHLNKFSNDLSVGSFVKKSDSIGYTGNSGLSTGPQLHFEILENKKRIDPAKIDKINKNKYLGDVEINQFNKSKRKIQEEINKIRPRAISQ